MSRVGPQPPVGYHTHSTGDLIVQLVAICVAVQSGRDDGSRAGEALRIKEELNRRLPQGEDRDLFLAGKRTF